MNLKKIIGISLFLIFIYLLIITLWNADNECEKLGFDAMSGDGGCYKSKQLEDGTYINIFSSGRLNNIKHKMFILLISAFGIFISSMWTIYLFENKENDYKNK